MPMLDHNSITKKQIILGSIICAVAALFYCYEFVLRIIPGVLQKELCAAFGHISASTFGQISALYYFAYSPMQMPVGMLMDRFGPRRLLFLACACCTLGSLMFSFSSSVPIASIGRFMVGFGSSFAFVGVLSLALHWLPRSYFSLIAGLMTTLGMFGLVYGEFKITEIVQSAGLSYVLFATVIIGLILTVLILCVVRDGPSNNYHAKTQTLKSFYREVLKVLISPQVWLIGFVGACLYTSLSVFGELWGKSYLEQAYHLSKMDAAKAISAMFLGWGVGAPIVGYLSDKSGRRVLPLVLGAIFSLICISLVLYYPNLSFTSVMILMFLYGIFSSSEIIVFIMAKEITGAQLSGTVFAATNMIVSLGGVFYQPLVGKLLDTFGDQTIINGEHVYSTMDYQLALSILPISLLLMIVAIFFIKDQRLQA